MPVLIQTTARIFLFNLTQQMPLTKDEFKFKAQHTAQLNDRANAIRISPALQAALESSKPTASIPQQFSGFLSKTYKSLSNMVNLNSSSSTDQRLYQHGVPTGFFRLPLEIREEIYDLVTGSDLHIAESYHETRSNNKKPNNRGVTNLLQICRQM